MNAEQIRELAFRAGFCRSDAGEFSNTMIGTTHEDALKNFAELIVRECAHVADISDDSGIWIGGAILTHFGVEERKDLVCPKCGVDRTLVDELQIECDRLYRIIELNGILK